MIPFASQRGGGQDLATHLQNTHDNEVMEVVEIRGAIARDLHGAFQEWEIQAETLTRCRKYLYSMSINPDPQQGELSREEYRDYIARVETSLGLSQQPRAIVFHTKHGREHCHVVWSRIDAEMQKAVQISFDHKKLMKVTREFARDRFLDLPAGYEQSRKSSQETLYERVIKGETGLSTADHIREVTEAWRHSDTPRAFVQAIAEKGYVLATGKRSYVLVDFYGGFHSLPKLIDDKSIRTRDIRAFLEKDFPEASLPSVEQAQENVARHRKTIEKSVNDLRHADQLAALQHSQQLRRKSVEQQAASLLRSHSHDREQLLIAQRRERHDLRMHHASKIKTIRAARREIPSSGLARFLGRVSGITSLRKAIHRHRDGKLVAAQRRERRALKRNQDVAEGALNLRQQVQAREITRQQKALKRIEKREAAALMRDNRRDQRTRDRGDDTMPSLAKVAGFENSATVKTPDLLEAFRWTGRDPLENAPDVLEAFSRAAWNASPDMATGDSGRDPDGPSDDEPERPGPDRGRS